MGARFTEFTSGSAHGSVVAARRGNPPMSSALIMAKVFFMIGFLGFNKYFSTIMIFDDMEPTIGECVI